MSRNQFFNVLTLGCVILFFSCTTTMTPTQVNNLLPRMTKAKFYSQVQAQESIESGGCKLLVSDRKYRAPLGFTISSDLKNGARGIDEWVSIDGGNAYYLKSYQWIPLHGSEDKTQLTIEFATMLCN